jgi:hypothetical protein
MLYFMQDYIKELEVQNEELKQSLAKLEVVVADALRNANELSYARTALQPQWREVYVNRPNRVKPVLLVSYEVEQFYTFGWVEKRNKLWMTCYDNETCRTLRSSTVWLYSSIGEAKLNIEQSFNTCLMSHMLLAKAKNKP